MTAGIALRTSLRIFGFVWTLDSYFMRRTLFLRRYIPPRLTRFTELRKHLHPPSYLSQSPRTLRITLSKTENTLSKTESSLSKSDVFVERLGCVERSKNGEYFTTMQTSRWHAFYLFSGQGIPRMLQGEILVFYCTFVLLGGHIFASIEKFGTHV